MYPPLVYTLFILLWSARVSAQCPKAGLNVSNSCWYATADNGNCTGHCASLNLTYVKPNISSAKVCATVVETYPPLRLKAVPNNGTGPKGCYWKKTGQTLHWDGVNEDPDTPAGNRTIRFCTCKTPPFSASWGFNPIFTAIVIVILFTCLAFELWTSEFLLFSAALILFLAGIITLPQLVQGFSNQGILTVAVLYICVRPLNDLRLLRVMVHRFILVNPKKPRLTLSVMYLFLGSLSWWLNNTPLVAMAIPFIKDWCRQHNVAPSLYLLPVSYAVIFGGVCTVIGTSTNLVVQGFLERDGQPKIGFFEIGVAGGFLLFAFGFFYVVLLAPILLPKSGGMFRLARERGTEFMMQLEVLDHCPLVGKPLEKLRGRLPRTEQLAVHFVEIMRREEDGETRVIFPIELSEILHAGDRVLVSGHVKGIMSTVRATKGLRLVAEDVAGATRRASDSAYGATEQTEHPFGVREDRPNTPMDADLLDPVVPNSPETAHDPYQPVADSSVAIRELDSIPHPQMETSSNSQNDSFGKGTDEADDQFRVHDGVEFYEVTLSRGNHAIDATVGSGVFQRHYQAAIIAVRPAHGGDRLGRGMEDVKLDVGDCLLILARESFYTLWASSAHFFVVARSGMAPDDIPDDQFYINFPHWAPRCCCLPKLKHQVAKHLGHEYATLEETLLDSAPAPKKARRVNVPWYPYISVCTFICMVTVAASGLYDILPAALCNAIFIIAIGILTPQQAIEAVDASVYIMVAASFAIGIAIEVSGLAANVASVTLSKLADPLSLFIVTAIITTFSTAVVTNNASAAIIYPLAAATAKQMGIPVKPLAVIVAVASSIDFATPFGYQTNLMVRGPGGYRCVDYARFGLILNCICPILLACNTFAYYNV